jgi:1A family penicillin-binding protein
LLYRPALLLPLPDAATLRSHQIAPSSVILDRQGRVLYRILDPHIGLQQATRLEEVPLALRQAILATEDLTFYDNPGVNLRAIARALWLNLRSGAIVSGGSTITQQLARNLLMAPEERYSQTWQRKAKEALLAYHLTRSLPKDAILELYLDQIYFGNMAYGVTAAARAYYGKPVAQLDLAEGALLAGLPQAPALYDPLTNLPAAKARQEIVLGLMVKAGFITATEAELAAREPLHFASSPFTIEAPHFVMGVRQLAGQLVGEEVLLQGGLTIHTTLDLNVQHAAEEVVRRQMAALARPAPGLPDRNARNAAVVVLDPATGAVAAMVGSPNYFDARSDGAVNAALALRQPGSALKPLTYAAAMERGLTPATVMADVRTAFATREGTPYVPLNYDQRFHGLVSLRQALACSYNVVAVRVLDQIGIGALPDMAMRLGITSLTDSDRHGLALTLGGVEVQLLQLTAAYGGLANGGWRVQPYTIERIVGPDGDALYERTPPPRERALDPRVANLITHILADDVARAPAFGRSSALNLPFPAAVKTGTTGDWRDNWTVGYSTAWAVGAWVGNADNEPMRGISGVDGAAPIWNGVMRALHGAAPQPFARPGGIVEAEICDESGLLPTSACTHRRRELFLAETVPVESCDLHRWITVDAASGALATADTPTNRQLRRRIVLWPAEVLPWAEEQGLVDPLLRALPASAAWDHALAQAPCAVGAPAPQRAATGLRLLSPDANASYRISAEIPAEAQRLEVSVSGAGCQPVTVWIDGHLWRTWQAPPYRDLWQLTPGEHTFIARCGANASESVRITVYASSQNGSSERTAP